MRRQITVAVCSMLLGLMTMSSYAVAQQKTAKACGDEWRANKAANQANGITEKAYVATCRGGAAPSQPASAPSAPPASTPAPSAAAPQTSTGQKTAKTCAEEWRANKAANQTNGVTEKAYVAGCRGGAAPSQIGTAPAGSPTSSPAPSAAAPQADTGQKTAKACAEEWKANKAANQANGVTEKAYVATCRSGARPSQTSAAPPAPAPAPSAAPAPTTTAAPTAKPASSPASNARPAPTNSGNPTGANEFSTEAQAKARCPGDTVVWVNLTSKIYHFSGTRNYGTTEHGAYMCEGDTAAAGMRAAKNEKHP
jgi:hypothetical protein